jgi:voltage-dependent calcium channel T type alpha-1G
LQTPRYQQQQRKEGLLPNTPETFTLSPHKIRQHHPKCSKFNNNVKAKNIQDSIVAVKATLNSTPNNNNHFNNEHQISSPENSEMVSLENLKNNNCNSDSGKDEKQKIVLLKMPKGGENELANVRIFVLFGYDLKQQLMNFLCLFKTNTAPVGLLSPPTSTRRRGSSVMFNEYVILHAPPAIPDPNVDQNSFSMEKMTQAGDGSVWQVSTTLQM